MDNECTKLRVSRAVLPHVPHILCMPTCSHVFVPLPFTYLLFVCLTWHHFTCLTCLHFFTCFVCLHFLHAWRAFVFFTCLKCLHFFYVLDVSSFLYVLDVSSFFTCLTCLHFFLRTLRVFIFLVPCEPPFFTCFTCLHTEVFKTEVLEVATKVRTNVII